MHPVLDHLQNIPADRVNEYLWKFAESQLAVGNGRVIIVDGSPYLTRIFLRTGDPDFGVFLHYFHKGDQFRDLHNHPWEWAYSIVLTGGYDEERFEADYGNWDKDAPLPQIVKKSHKPGDINWLTSKTYHRVDLPNGGAWTLFVRGPRLQGWGFMNRETGEFSSMAADITTND